MRRAIAVIAALVLCFGAGFAAAAATQSKERVIKVVSRRFTFTPNNIVIHKGEAVRLEITSEDVLMGFNAPDFSVRSDIPPGQVTVLHLQPDEVGTFTFLCDIFCGSGHENMNGTLTVVE
jgi:cytochrome c oxidase subunit 2